MAMLRSCSTPPEGRRRRAGRIATGLAAVALTVGTPALLPVVATAAPAPPAADAAAAGPGGLVVVAARPALPGGTRALGHVPATATVRGAVALQPRDPAALSSFATAVSTPGSADYHRYLPAGSFASTFGPTPATIAAVRGVLAGAGLEVTSVARDGLLVNFSGPAARAEAAFHTGLEDYRLASGRIAPAETTAIRLPAAVAGQVAGVVGLDDLAVARSAGVLPGARGHAAAAAPAAPTPEGTAAVAAGGPSACAGASEAATEYGGLTDTQIAASYGVDGLYAAGDTGAGQSIAVYELEPFERSDIAAFDRCFFPKKATSMLGRLGVTPVDGGQQVGYGSGEAELDIDDVSALAPGASIQVYEAPNSTYGGLDEYDTIIDDDAQKVVTSSWGECELNVQQLEPGVQQIENTLFEQAAAQGQSVFAAAGDAGSDSCAYHATSPIAPDLSTLDPASQPYVTAVGGTTITDATQPPVEHVWNDGSDWGAGGGGISATWAAPSWQAADSVPGLDNTTVVAAAEKASGGDFCGSAVCREVPDVSAQADEFTGAITVYFEGAFFTVGGTSSATPLWAAMLTDIDASRACSAGGGVGFANPALYAVASSPSEYAASFSNVTTGNNDAYSLKGGLYPATKGYSMAAGLGSPKVTDRAGGGGLDADLCAVGTSSAAVKITGVSPKVLPLDGSSGTEVSITGHGWATSGASAVASVDVGAYAVPAADVTVVDATTIDLSDVTAADMTGAFGATPGDATPDGNGTYDVSVALVDGRTGVTPASDAVTFVDGSAASTVPDVSAVATSGGPSSGGTPVRIYGSGFTPTGDTVTFGGVAASGYGYVSPDEITTTTPAQTGATCAIAGEPASGLCQVEVVVSDTDGSSPVETILPEISGALTFNSEGILQIPSGCGCEVSPTTTEFDYLPAPHIAHLSIAPASAADENGGTVATITGTGFAYLGYLWTDVGTPSVLATSADFTDMSVTPTKIVIGLPAEATTATPLDEQVAVQTLASPNLPPGPGLGSAKVAPSNVVTVTYGPLPDVTGITTRSKYSAGPTTGGTHMVIKGSGFAAGDTVEFVDTISPFGASDTTTGDITVNAAGTEITLATPNDNPGIDAVEVCSTVDSMCTPPLGRDDVFTFYPLGNPAVRTVSSHDGKAGTKLTVTGANLGFLEAVDFGPVAAKVFANAPGIIDPGSLTTITVTVPAGLPRGKVHIRVETLESRATGFNHGTAKSYYAPAVYVVGAG
jgi:hypothetical protein